jgi:hypothetical protein
MVKECRRALFLLLWQRDPRLDPVHVIAVRAGTLESFRVRDTAPGCHPVDLTGADGLL